MEKKDLKAKRRLFNPTRARTGELLILLLIVSVSSICPIRFTCTRIFSFFCCICEGLRRTQGKRSELEKRAHCIGLKNCCCINRESDEVWSSRGLSEMRGKCPVKQGDTGTHWKLLPRPRTVKIYFRSAFRHVSLSHLFLLLRSALYQWWIIDGLSVLYISACLPREACATVWWKAHLDNEALIPQTKVMNSQSSATVGEVEWTHREQMSIQLFPAIVDFAWKSQTENFSVFMLYFFVICGKRKQRRQHKNQAQCTEKCRSEAQKAVVKNCKSSDFLFRGRICMRSGN